VTGVDLHPEELFDRMRRGTASADEQRRATDHLAGCLACRAEQALITDGAAAAARAAGDGGALARVQAGARRTILRRVHARRGRRRGAGEGRLVGRFRFAPALVATVLLAAAVAGAAPFIHRAWLLRRAPAPAQADRQIQTAPQRAAEPAGPDPVASPPAVEPGREPARRSRHAAARPPRIAVAEASPETAGQLFARANQARRGDDSDQVIALYRRLQRDFPGSREAAVSRVALGRWLLDRMHQPGGALAEFDAYLQQGRHDTLREEALVGRAMALQQLRRDQDERRAWEALLAAFPRSTFAARARARVEALP